MGNCILCQKQTDNRYLYYSGHKRVKSASPSITPSCEKPFDSVEYYVDNLKQHSEYLCTKCAIQKLHSLKDVFIGAIIVFLLIPVFFISFPTKGLVSSIPIIALWLVSISAVFSLYNLLCFLMERRRINIDKECNENEAARIIIQSRKRKDEKAKEVHDYFTPGEHSKFEHSPY